MLRARFVCDRQQKELQRHAPLDRSGNRVMTPAMELISKVPIIKTKGLRTWCDGGALRRATERSEFVVTGALRAGAGALGHPRVYISLEQPGAHACGYCGLRYESSDHHDHH